MTKTAIVRARIEPSVKEKAEKVLRKIGLTPSQAIGVFYRRVAVEKTIPFSLHVPNARTRATIRAVERGEGKTYKSVDELLSSALGKEWDAKYLH
ncbi:MAG TPA: type II toxin-antitoxin system RelB/DinJ family antitoxin [Candidatus Kaiserbacteria bacterium]|nr:type II toxin-antitoxin system RelB/DinJ family antitoxin [Candidatus Kaiserbacteria bacterium]